MGLATFHGRVTRIQRMDMLNGFASASARPRLAGLGSQARLPAHAGSGVDADVVYLGIRMR